jgi:hypothetical protein
MAELLDQAKKLEEIVQKKKEKEYEMEGIKEKEYEMEGIDRSIGIKPVFFSLVDLRRRS